MARACLLAGVVYDQFDANNGVGGLWDIDQPGSAMYESAHLISSKSRSGFEGFPMPDDFPDYPSHRQVLAYIQTFAARWGLSERIEFRTQVTDIERQDDDSWIVTLSSGERRRYLAVICATGSNWEPRVPELRGQFHGEIRHSSSYRSPHEFIGKRVLVVGAGNSGVDIASDAARFAERAFISVRRGYHFLPKHIMGIPTDVVFSTGPNLPLWAKQILLTGLLRFFVGDVTRLGLPRPDHKPLESHPIINTQVLYHLQHGDLTAKPDIDRLDVTGAVFKDGSREELDTIILATGYTQHQAFSRDYFVYEGGRPNLYMQLFSREHKNLIALSFIETNSGAFKLFDKMAFAIAGHIRDQIECRPEARAFSELIKNDYPDLTGGIRLVSSDRHSSYFDSETWQAYLGRIYSRMGWVLPQRHAAIADGIHRRYSRNLHSILYGRAK